MATKMVVHPHGGHQCSDLTALPADISKLVNLQVLDLTRHSNSQYAGLDTQQDSLAAVWEQTQLRELNLPVSNTMATLSPDISTLHNLHTLRLD
jgi:hypothetical protein